MVAGDALELAARGDVALVLFIVYGIAELNGRQSERREAQPHSHYESAKKQAEPACVGVKSEAVLECVYDTIQASEDTARTEQDLTAQQRAAWAAMIGAGIAFLALGATVIGLYYVRETLRATLKAVKDTGDATQEMRKANEITNRVAEAELRPYLFVDHLEAIDIKSGTEEVEEDGETRTVPGYFAARVAIHLRNYGKLPARNIHVSWRTFYGRFFQGRFEEYRRSWVDTPVCAPGHERRVFTHMFVNSENRSEFDDGSYQFIIRLRFSYTDDRGGEFTECADYHLGGDDLDTFYLLLGPHNIKERRDRWAEIEPGLYDEGDD